MNWQKKREMSGEQFKAAIRQLGMTQAGAARYFGCGERTIHRYCSGEIEVQASDVLLLRSLIHHNEVPLVPKE